MPPSRYLLQYSCRGFICQSCVSKLSRPRPLWWASSRNISSESPAAGQAPKRIRYQVEENDTSQSDVRYFDDKGDGTREEINISKNAGAIKELDERILELQAKIEKIKSGELSSEEQEMEKEMDQLTDEQRNELLDAIGKATDPQNDPLIPHFQHNFDVDVDISSLPPLEARRLLAFIKVLRRTALSDEFTDLQQQNVWKQYTMAHRVLIDLADRVPIDVWTFLWTVFAKTAIKNPLRLGRLKTLAENMENAGITLSDTQVLVYMEAWYLHGHRNSALSRWRSLIETLGKKDSSVFRQFWEMGIRMLAMNGFSQEALEATVALFKDDPDADPRIVIPIIASLVASDDEKKLQKAWIVYRRLQVALSETIEMKDYDAIATIFLAANLPGLALGVFRDMMIIGNQTKGVSKPDMKLIFANLFDKSAQASSTLEIKGLNQPTKMQDIDWTAFEALAHLPHNTRNKFFFGSWIKKLLGVRDIAGALQVLELMRKYRVRPDAIQLNGVVGALLRSKSSTSVAMGEKIAWNMVKVRSNFVNVQKRLSDFTSPLKPVLPMAKPNFIHAIGDVSTTPAATSETLALLIESYRRRHLQSYVEELWRVLKMLDLRPNVYILNQFMLSYHRARDEVGMYRIYHKCVDVYHVTPDLDTIKWLWMFMKQRPKSDATNQVRARQIFQTTMKYLPHSLNSEAETMVMEEIYDLVMSCFGLLDDQVGTAIAIQAFQQHPLKLYPSEQTLTQIIRQLSSSDGLPRRMKTPPPFRAYPSPKQDIQVHAVIEKIKHNRAEDLKSQGIQLNMKDKNVQGQERMFLLIELLKNLFIVKMDAVAGKWSEQDAEKGIVRNEKKSERSSVLFKNHVMQAAFMMGGKHDVKKLLVDTASMMGVANVKPWKD